jgi:SAM-dependent methyltransferase
VSAPLPAALPPSIAIVDSPCFLCGAAAADPVWRTPDRAFGVPGSYAVVRCRSCGFLYQRPRVADAHLAACYPDHYPRHQEPSPRVPLKGKPGRVRAARWALASGLGYRGLAPDATGALTRLRGRWLLRRIRWDCPPWTGQGRYLDVGCGSGGTLAVARALGWRTAGIEVDAAAAEHARPFADELHVGDAFGAPFAPGRFDVVSAFHVLEHVPDPVALLRRMLDWLAPGGLLIVEVPNVGGWGRRSSAAPGRGSSCRGTSPTSRRRASSRRWSERAGASCGAASRPSRATTSGACASGFATAARSGSRGSPNGAQPMARSSSAWSSRSRSSPAPGAGKPSASA